jgi:2-amino-4-hydroxy-6-hydroxymethyldihydropteridine diphosphokinase
MTGQGEQIALALGSNRGDREGFLRAAIKEIGAFVDVTAVSPFLETQAEYVTDQPAFINAALIGTALLAPLDLLKALKDLEQQLGRRPSFRYGPREIDIDILFYGDQIFQDDALQIPHPRLAERDFVLRPLAVIAPDWRHPVTGHTVADMLATLAQPA